MEPVPVGKLAAADAQRDAIHIAIIPVVAKEDAWPGSEVGVDGTRTAPYVGIVDPFLKDQVKEGERYYIFLFPNTVTGMRHHWEHPLFDRNPEVVDKTTSRKWMEQYAASHYSSNERFEIDGRDCGYRGWGGVYTAEQVIQYAKDYLRTGDRHVQQGADSLRDNTNAKEFWHHFQVLTGIVVPSDELDTVPFCCTC